MHLQAINGTSAYEFVTPALACNCSEKDVDSEEYRLGDVTNDGMVDVRDVIRLTPVLLGQPLQPEDGNQGTSYVCTELAGDNDGNGKVTVQVRNGKRAS